MKKGAHKRNNATPCENMILEVVSVEGKIEPRKGICP